MISIRNVRVSQKAKSQLMVLKRRTGINQWNILCRWAFCLSLSEPSKPQLINISTDSNIDMTWRTFTGAENELLYWALLKARCVQDNLPQDEKTLTQQFNLHLHRGIGYLSVQGKVNRLEDLINLINKQ